MPLRRTVSFATVRAACLEHVVLLAPQIVPGGRWRGDWYWATVPWRDDKRGSLAVSRTTARWRDWGYEDPDNGSTLIDLGARLWGCTTADAKDRIAGMLGLQPEAAILRFPAKKRPKCKDCRHAWERFGDELALRYDYAGPPDIAAAPFNRYCTSLVNALGEPRPTEYLRRATGACGIFGRRWEAR